jgi:hypothetical protein
MIAFALLHQVGILLTVPVAQDPDGFETVVAE